MFNRIISQGLLCVVCLLAVSTSINASQPINTSQPIDNQPLSDQAFQIQGDYRSTPGVYGTVTSIGSDTLAGLMAIWAQRFQELYPHVKFQIQATGSATASQALTQGTASIGPMSRALSPQEVSEFSRVHGYQPTAIVVAMDAIAIYVEKNNPLERLTLRQVDALFSVTRLCGASESILRWQQLGVTKFGQDRTIQLFGRNSASGTYDLFKLSALCNGDYLRVVNEMPSSSSIVQSIASSVGAIGYAALGYKNTNVKTIAIQSNALNTSEFYAPTPEHLRSGKYPFTRNLYIIVNKNPNKPLASLEGTFLRFILSEDGQALVEQNGYFGVTKLSPSSGSLFPNYL
jgi:phosphate transport system substrate-binding protein